MKKIRRVWINDKKSILPFIKITEEFDKNQIIFSMNYGGSHLTIHKQDDGVFLGTHYNKDKEKGVWDDSRAAVAKALGYKNWEKHSRYYFHDPLRYTINPENKRNAAHLVGMGFQKEKLKVKNRHKKDEMIIIDIDEKDDFFEIYFNDKDYPIDTIYQNTITTFLGSVHINFKKYTSHY